MDGQRRSKIRRSNVGFVSQNYNPVEDLTVQENVSLTMMFEGKTDGEMKERTSELLDKVGLVDKEQHRPSQLSVGEQQPVAIARALANRPRLVLMDEPTGNLDHNNSQSIMRLVTSIIKADGVTFIIATHNFEIMQETPSKLFLKTGQGSNGLHLRFVTDDHALRGEQRSLSFRVPYSQPFQFVLKVLFHSLCHK